MYNIGTSKLVRGDVTVAAQAEQAARAASAVPTPHPAAEVREVPAPEHMPAGEHAVVSSDAAPVADSALPAGLYLVATHVCPNCHRAEDLLDETGVPYELLFAEENQELVERYGLMQAPTLLRAAGDGTVQVTAGAPAVFKEIAGLQAAAR